MTIDFDIMAKVQAVLAPELYQALCEYIEYREDISYDAGMDDGYATCLDTGE